MSLVAIRYLHAYFDYAALVGVKFERFLHSCLERNTDRLNDLRSTLSASSRNGEFVSICTN